MRLFTRALILGVFLASGMARADDNPVVATTALRCATDEAQARLVVDEIAASFDVRFGLPHISSETPNHITARSIDTLLWNLRDTIRKYPSLRTAIEAVVLSWNFCEVNFENRPWDLAIENGQISRHEPNASPGWPGFLVWGFLTPDATERYIPELAEHNSLIHEQREWFRAALRNDRCFPDSRTGKTIYDADDAVASDVRRVLLQPSSATLLAQCPGPIATSVSAGSAPPALAPAAAKQAPIAAPALPAKLTNAVALVAVPVGEKASAVNMPTVAAGTTHGFSGAFAYEQRVTGGRALATGVAFAPFSFAFARIGLKARLDEGKDPVGYSWGVGYDDWHPGTFSAQINDWGPRALTAKPMLNGAALDIGYKIPYSESILAYFATGVTLNVPFDGSPGLVTSLTFKPGGHWVLFGSLRASPFGPTPLTWAYGFGFMDYRPFTFSMGVANWGPNTFPHSNFEKNAALTTSWSWAF